MRDFPPTHPGEILIEEFLSQWALALILRFALPVILVCQLDFGQASTTPYFRLISPYYNISVMLPEVLPIFSSLKNPAGR